MKEFNSADKINLEVEVKDLTLEDLYRLYEKNRTISLIKIIGGKLKLFLDKEE